jgi:hypothetical protein
MLTRATKALLVKNWCFLDFKMMGLTQQKLKFRHRILKGIDL